MAISVTGRVVPIGLASLFLAAIVCAQTVGASLQGVVTDSTGAAIRDADVVVLNVATGAVRELKTDGTGRYREYDNGVIYWSVPIIQQ